MYKKWWYGIDVIHKDVIPFACILTISMDIYVSPHHERKSTTFNISVVMWIHGHEYGHSQVHLTLQLLLPVFFV